MIISKIKPKNMQNEPVSLVDFPIEKDWDKFSNRLTQSMFMVMLVLGGMFFVGGFVFALMIGTIHFIGVGIFLGAGMGVNAYIFYRRCRYYLFDIQEDNERIILYYYYKNEVRKQRILKDYFSVRYQYVHKQGSKLIFYEDKRKVLIQHYNGMWDDETMKKISDKLRKIS